jgi:Enoyl-(Acyl carrier protein) reductase
LQKQSIQAIEPFWKGQAELSQIYYKVSRARDGWGSGIGRVTSLLLANQGAKVMIADYVTESALKTVTMMEEAGGIADYVASNVSDAGQVEMMVNQTIATHGRIDCAFNNAGIEGAIAHMAECSAAKRSRSTAAYEKLSPLYTEYNIGNYIRQFTLNEEIEPSGIQGTHKKWCPRSRITQAGTSQAPTD